MRGTHYGNEPLSEGGRPQMLVVDRNSAKCLGCGDEIESKSRHDFRGCTCGNLFVDGGLDYVRTGYHSDGPGFEDTSQTHYEPMSNEEIQQYHDWKIF